MADACQTAGWREWAVSGPPGGGSGRTGIGSAPAGVGPCACVLQGAPDGEARRACGLAARYVYRGVGHGEGPSGSPCHLASGLSSPVGKVAMACACAMADLWVLRLPLAAPYQGALSHLGAISVASVLCYIRSSTAVVRSWTEGKSRPFGSKPTPSVTGAGSASSPCKDGGEGHT